MYHVCNVLVVRNVSDSVPSFCNMCGVMRERVFYPTTGTSCERFI